MRELSAHTLRLRDDTLLTWSNPWIMGVVNRSPNSFFNPMNNNDQALREVERMVNAGVHIIDVGGEASNPFVNIEQESPDTSEELARVAPCIELIKARFDVLVSVDTSYPAVMRAAVEAGADIINDQRALQMPEALATAAELQTPVCLMHGFYPPREAGSSSLKDFLQRVKYDLSARIAACQMAGIPRDRLIIDPGFGQGHYGKNCDENSYLLAHLPALTPIAPVLVGWSRKSMIGDILQVPIEDRLYGSLAAATMAAILGAAIIRVHDVPESMDAIKIVNAIQAVVNKEEKPCQ